MHRCIILLGANRSGITGYISLIDHTEQGGSVPDECSCYYRNSGYSSSSESGRSQIRVIKQTCDPGYPAQIESLIDNLVPGCECCPRYYKSVAHTFVVAAL